MIDPTKVVADSEQDYKIMQDQRAEIARLRLTDEERAALHWFAHYGLPEHRAATLRALLARMTL
jgi:hypothetical protein